MLRGPGRTRWWRGILAIGVSIPVLAAAFVFWRVSRARQEAAAEVAGAGEFRFQTVPVARALPPGVESISANPAFRDIALFQGKIAVSGRGGLFVYDRAGTLQRVYRAGFELPPAELGEIAAGILAGASEPELLIATRAAGLLIFNGAGFRQMLPERPDLRTVTAMLVLGSGRILLGTERKGLLVFDGRRLAPFHPRLDGAHVTALAGSEGDLWIGTREQGVFRYHAGQLEELRESLPDPHVVALLAEEGAAWAGTPLGVVEFSEGRPRRTLADGFFARTLARRGETLHIGTEDEGIVEIPLGSRRAPRPVPEALTVRRLARLDSELFALTDDAIHRYEPARQGWERVLNSASAVLADRNIAALGASEGRLWVGYFDRGLDILPPELDRASHYEDDTLFCINRIVSSPLRGAAVATANGLVLFDSAAQPRQVMGRKEGLLADHVTDIAFRDGGMVVATGAGLSFVDRFGVRSLYAFHGLVNNHVYTVAAQGRRTVAGTLGGVSVLDGDVVRANYTTANSHLRHNWITALARVGDEWFAGTYGAGVLRFVPGGDWRRFTDLPEALVVNPNALLVSGGGVYAGTLDRGLFIYDRATGRWTGTTGGLPSLNVTALTSYGGYLYIGTDNGLVRMPAGALP